MRKSILFILFLTFCFTLQVTMPIVYAATWKPVGASNSFEYFFDTESTRYITPEDEKFIEVWRYCIYKSTQSDGGKYQKDKIWLKLDRKAYAIKAEYRYDVNNNVIKSFTQRGSWIDTIPGSVGERFYDVVKAYYE